MLQNIAAQSVGHRQLALTLVVNNSPEVARKRDGIFAENQETLRYLERARGTLPFELRVVDLSTMGIERNMGRLRQIAALTALDTPVANDRYILIMGDADTSFAPGHFARLIAHYETMGVDAVYSRLQMDLRDPNDLTSILSAPYNNYEFRNAMLERSLLYGTDGVGAPQISVSADKFLEVGGFPDVTYAEDAALTKKLASLRVHFDPDLVVHTEDRAREDGFDAAFRWDFNKTFSWATPMVVVARDTPDLIAGWKVRGIVDRLDRRHLSPHEALVRLHKLFSRLKGGEMRPIAETSFLYGYEEHTPSELILALFPDYLLTKSERPGLDFFAAMRIWATPGPEEEEILSRLDRLRTKRIFESGVRIQFLRDWLNGRECACDPSDEFVRLFCAPRSSLAHFFKKLRAGFDGEDDAIYGFLDFFPDWLGTWDESTVRTQDDLMALAEELALRALNQPERYPGLYSYVHDVQR